MLFAYVHGEEQVWVYLNKQHRGGFSIRLQEKQLLLSCFAEKVWGRLAAQSHGIGAVGRQSEGSAQRGVEDRTLTVSLAEHCWQLVVL